MWLRWHSRNTGWLNGYEGFYHTGRNFDAGIDIASRMDPKFATMVPVAHQMQYDMNLMTHRMLNVTGPMNCMSSMFPMSK